MVKKGKVKVQGDKLLNAMIQPTHDAKANRKKFRAYAKMRGQSGKTNISV